MLHGVCWRGGGSDIAIKLTLIRIFFYFNRQNFLAIAEPKTTVHQRCFSVRMYGVCWRGGGSITALSNDAPLILVYLSFKCLSSLKNSKSERFIIRKAKRTPLIPLKCKTCMSNDTPLILVYLSFKCLTSLDNLESEGFINRKAKCRPVIPLKMSKAFIYCLFKEN